MHEIALADAVLTAALEVADREGISRITHLLVKVGELQSINNEIFKNVFEEILPAAEPRLKGAKITLETEPARFVCRACGEEFDLAATWGPRDKTESEAIHFVPELAHGYLRCPACESPDFEVIEGRGVLLHTVEGE